MSADPQATSVTRRTLLTYKFRHYADGFDEENPKYTTFAIYVPNRNPPDLSKIGSEVVAYRYVDVITTESPESGKSIVTNFENQSGWIYPDAKIDTGNVVDDRFGRSHRLEEGDTVIEVDGKETVYRRNETSRSR